jgi:hypothetical protein
VLSQFCSDSVEQCVAALLCYYQQSDSSSILVAVFCYKLVAAQVVVAVKQNTDTGNVRLLSCVLTEGS